MLSGSGHLGAEWDYLMLYLVDRGTKLGLLPPNIQEKFVGVDLFILA